MSLMRGGDAAQDSEWAVEKSCIAFIREKQCIVIRARRSHPTVGLA